MKKISNFFKQLKQWIKQLMKDSPPVVKFIPLGVIVVILVVTFTTCGRRTDNTPEEPSPTTIEEMPSEEPSKEPEKEDEPEPGGDEETEIDEEPEQEPEPPKPVNPLTGLPVDAEISSARPLAIMVNNHRDAMPQVGISKADIIYEILVEGGITRMMALYQDVSGVGVIGSIRSSRHYYVNIAQGYDAVYIFAGGSPQAYSALSSRNITRLDGTDSTWSHTEIFYRDQQRAQTMRFEHTLVISSELVEQWLTTYGYRLDHEDDFKCNLSFVEDGTPAFGNQALDFSVKFSSSKSTSFLYDPGDGLYYLSQYDKEYIDGNDGTQVSATNVLILQTSVSPIPGDGEGRLEIATTGSGKGYFICGGRYTEINWSRADNSSQFSYTLANGSNLVLGQGKTYICIVPSSMAVELS